MGFSVYISKTLTLISVLYLLIMVNLAYAETFKMMIKAQADAVVQEDKPKENEGKDNMLGAGWVFPNDPEQQGLRSLVSYLQLNIKDIPKSNVWTDVMIDSVQLKLLIQALPGTAEGSVLMVNYCSDSSWSEAQITWNNRVCKDEIELEGQDSMLIRKSDLSNVYSWDVTSAVRDARDRGLSNVTFVITAVNLPDIGFIPEGKPSSLESPDGVAWFWSKEKEEFGVSAAPTLEVTYTTTPSQLTDSSMLILTVVLPTLAIVVPAIIWLYRRIIK